MKKIQFALVVVVLLILAAQPAFAQRGRGRGRGRGGPPQPMSFFITSVGPGNGADLGGLEGADRYCQELAEAAGRGGVTWRAVPQHDRRGRRQRARPDRRRAMVQRQRRESRSERRGSAR